MNPEKTSTMELYKVLGKLFYAISATDGTVRQEEVNTLNQIVASEWLAFDPNADQIQPEFDNLVTHNDFSSSDCLQAFKSFKEANDHLFSEEIKKLIWKTVSSIAFTVAHNNKSELVMLSQIKIILSQ